MMNFKSQISILKPAGQQTYLRLCLVLVLTAAVMIGGFVLQACGPTQSQMDKAAVASRSIANYTGETIAIVKGLYEAGALKLEVKDKLAKQLVLFSKGGRDFNSLVKTASDLYKNGAVPVDVWRNLVTHFDELTKIFVDILTLIPQAAGLKDSKAFKIITAAVVVIAQILLANGINVPQWPRIEQHVPGWRALQREVTFELA
jgi:hypothetical protein